VTEPPDPPVRIESDVSPPGNADPPRSWANASPGDDGGDRRIDDGIGTYEHASIVLESRVEHELARIVGSLGGNRELPPSRPGFQQRSVGRDHGPWRRPSDRSPRPTRLEDHERDITGMRSGLL
jgi:hypothetical protein